MKTGVWKFALVGLIVSLLLAVLSPLASSHPDGLERVVEEHGPAAAEARQPPVPMPDYAMPGVASESAATILAGLAGTLAVFAAALLLGRLVARRGRPADQEKPVETPAPR